MVMKVVLYKDTSQCFGHRKDGERFRRNCVMKRWSRAAKALRLCRVKHGAMSK